MSEYLEFDLSPINENCAQLGSKSFYERSCLEYEALVAQIKRKFPDIPDTVRFKKGSCPHDFGTYYELRVSWVDEPSREFVFKLESEFPEYWDDEARKFLTEKGYFKEVE